jgi:glycosyltransferase involved in cell wall biosynthesis
MTAQAGRTMNILHCFDGGEGANAELSIRERISALGWEARHRFADATGGSAEFPLFSGTPGPGKLIKLARAMAQYDLVLTYGWGATNVAMAHSVFGQNLGLPPLVHHEAGLGCDPEQELGLKRSAFRRIALRSASSVIVDTQALGEAAARNWHIARQRIQIIPPGFDMADFSRKARADQIPGLVKREGEMWLGARGADALANTWSAIVEAFALMPQEWHLVIVGEFAARDAVRGEADRLGISHRVHLPGAVADTPEGFALFDMYVAAPCGLAFPQGTAKAMAAGLAVCAVQGDESANMPPAENARFLARSNDSDPLADALVAQADDALGRSQAGRANRIKAQTQYDTAHCLTAYRKAYSAALGQEI